MAQVINLNVLCYMNKTLVGLEDEHINQAE